MKKLILSLMLITATSAIYSQSKKQDNKMETSVNKEITLNLSRAIMTGQWDKVDALLDDYFK